MVLLLSLYVLIVYSGTATTEIYTHRHTLALPDALPLSPVPDGAFQPLARDLSANVGKMLHASHVGDLENAARPFDVAALAQAPHHAVDVNRGQAQRRPEEHTSELQSLMSSSYSVFSLHIKKHTTTTINTKQSQHS